MSIYKQHTSCRVCGNPLERYIDLGMLPLSNNLCQTNIERANKYPLQVMLCKECGLSQLSIVIFPEILFGHYVYRSSINKGYVDHCHKMAKELKETYGLTKDSFMVDIAGNDGALLREFKSEIGLKILNVDPAENLGALCRATGIPTLTHFWSRQTALRLLNSSGYGKVDLITATNVIAHVDNIYDFLWGVRLLLKPGGVCVLEFPYLMDFIENGEFDTIYFEHLSYMSIKPLNLLCKMLGLNITRIEKQQIHGGSVRVHIGFGIEGESVQKYIDNESKLTIEDYKKFAEDSYYTIRNFADNLYQLKSNGSKIAGFAASAKGNTLLNCAGISFGIINYIVDETPEKIGKYSPGTHIPIVSMLELMTAPPDYLIILSWNFSNEIISKCRDAGYEGKFIIPIPEFKVVEDCKLEVKNLSL